MPETAITHANGAKSAQRIGYIATRYAPCDSRKLHGQRSTRLAARSTTIDAVQSAPAASPDAAERVDGTRPMAYVIVLFCSALATAGRNSYLPSLPHVVCAVYEPAAPAIVGAATFFF